ncbi:MAG: hypothetical protein LAN18_01125 [Acidobacteriia bacterium]|nr:hypothetical protein [Terriglobia bacterium]
MIRVTKHIFVSALFTMIVIAACTGIAQAQGSRKDDIVFNAQGRPMAGATVRVCTSGATGQPCAPLAQIYSDAALTQALANPTSTDGLGNYSFYAAPGRYMIEISGPGITTKQLPNVILPSDPSSPTFTSVTTTSGISAFSLSLTGNLTVNGSTAVVGSLTVGGAPVPSTKADNQWTNNQRFKGPDPWRDFTAYMPTGGCSSTDSPGYFDTGTVGAGSSTMTVTTSHEIFKNGCGIAVLHAGPTATINRPGAGCSISSITGSGTLATITCAAPHGLIISTPDYGNGAGYGMVVAGVTDTSFNGTFTVSTVPDSTHITYRTAHSGSSSGGTANTLWGYAHGVTGSTTYNYKLVNVDGHMGYSAASAAISITNGNATLSATDLNYNWINVPMTVDYPLDLNASAFMTAVYSDKGLGGAYSCIGVTYSRGFSDYGLGYDYPTVRCPQFLPATPPSSPGNQTLNTTIVSGGGTSTLTLAAAATNAITSQSVLHDESSFLQACVNDVIADQASVGGNNASSMGCYIPAGFYWMNNVLPTANGTSNYLTRINVAGTLRFDLLPWFIQHGGWDIEGVGSGGSGSGYAVTPSTQIAFAHDGFVLTRSVSQTLIKGFALPNMNGHGIYSSGGGVAGNEFGNLYIGDGAGSNGAPIWLDNGTRGFTFNNVSLTPRDSGGLPIAVFTMSDYGGDTVCCNTFNNLVSYYHGMRIDGPAGNLTGGGISGPTVHGWLSESNHDAWMINHDNGDNAPGTGAINAQGVTLEDVSNADAYQTGFVHQRYGMGTATAPHTYSSFNLAVTNSFDGSLMSCGPDASCDVPGVAYTAIGSNDTNAAGSRGGGTGFSTGSNAVTIKGMPLLLKANKPQLVNYGMPALEMVLPPATNFTATAGSGSLSAGTWCAVVYGYDSQATPGYTDPSHEICTTVGGSSSIAFTWTYDGYLRGMYAGWRIYYGPSSGGENKYYDLGVAGSYTLTTDGGTGGSLPTGTPNAFLSKVNWNGGGSGSCLLCGSTTYPASAGALPLGIGVWPVDGSGVKLDVGGGTIRGQGGIQAGTDTAFNASPRGAYNAFLPNLTSAAGTYQRMTLDKAITVTRFQLVLGTAGSGCTTQSTVSVTDGANSVTLTTANGTAIYDSGAVSQNFAAAANLDIKIATAASGCTTAPQNANVTAQYRMQ